MNGLDELKELADSLKPPPAEDLVLMMDIQEVLGISGSHHVTSNIAKRLGFKVQKVKVPHGWGNAVTHEEAKAIIREYYNYSQKRRSHA